MLTTITFVGLSCFLAGSLPESPSWKLDYYLAQSQGKAAGKPLAVFISSGKDGWEHVSKDGMLSKEAKRILAGEYVCLYVDTKSSAGRELAATFDIPEGSGIVLSDRTGEVQAFRH